MISHLPLPRAQISALLLACTLAGVSVPCSAAKNKSAPLAPVPLGVWPRAPQVLARPAAAGGVPDGGGKPGQIKPGQIKPPLLRDQSEVQPEILQVSSLSLSTGQANYNDNMVQGEVTVTLSVPTGTFATLQMSLDAPTPLPAGNSINPSHCVAMVEDGANASGTALRALADGEESAAAHDARQLSPGIFWTIFSGPASTCMEF